jgi:predicted dehydrogenase
MKRFRTLVVGCGHMSHAWLSLVVGRSDVEIVGLVDPDVAAAERKKGKYELDVPVFVSIAPALAATAPDLVLDVVVPEARREVVTRALAAGCHVLSEKPMAASLADARELVAAADRAGRTFAVMQNRRYLAPMRALHELVAGGAIGRPGFVGADFFMAHHVGGFRTTMAHPLLLDMAIHTFDQARFLTGADPVSVYCQEFNLDGSWFAGDASAVCVFELSGGIVFCYRGSWTAEGARTSWESSWRIAGSAGTAIWQGDDPPYAETPTGEPRPGNLWRDGVRVDAKTDWQGRPHHAGCLDEMLAALAAGRPPETDCHDNVKSIAMVFAAIESARAGRKVDVAW